GLKGEVEATDVDTELEGGGGNDAGVGSSGEALFGGLSLFFRDGAVVDEYLDRFVAHLIGHGFGQGARLTEEEALSPLAFSHRRAAKVLDVFAQVDGDAALGFGLRRVDDDALTLRGAGQPASDLLRVADGGAEADALDVVLGEL